MSSDTRAVLQALHSHLRRNRSISGPELTAAAGFDHPDSASRIFRKLVDLRILRAAGQRAARRWSWADPAFARMSEDELAAEFERRDAAAKGKPAPKTSKPTSKPTSRPVAPPPHPPPRPHADWLKRWLPKDLK